MGVTGDSNASTREKGHNKPVKGHRRYFSSSSGSGCLRKDLLLLEVNVLYTNS